MERVVDDVMHVPEWAAPTTGWSTNPGYRAAALSLGYLVLYLALDRFVRHQRL